MSRIEIQSNLAKLESISRILFDTYTLMYGEETDFSRKTSSRLDKSVSLRRLYDQWVRGIVWEEGFSGFTPN
jgi:hypothetical protein